ncbi:MAG: ATP-binding protein [Thiobacillus sp.]
MTEPKRNSIGRQAVTRLVISLGLLVALIAVSSVAIYQVVLHKAAQNRAKELVDFYSARLDQIEREWEIRSRDFKVRIETTRALEDPANATTNLQAFMTIQGSERPFQYLLIQTRDGKKLFDFGKDLSLPSIPASAGEGLGHYLEPTTGQFYRVFEHPIWLGEARGMGRFAVFFRIDNALLRQMSTPGLMLSALHQGEPVASSGGQEAIDLLRRSPGVDGKDETIRELPWAGKADIHTRLRIEAPVATLFSTTELSVGMSMIPVVDGLLLWLTIGLWLMHQTRRVTSLGQAVDEYTATQHVNEAMATSLASAHNGQTDEIAEVADAIEVFVTTIDQREQEREAFAGQLRASEQRYRQMFESMSSGVVVYEALDGGADFLIRDINAAGERIESMRREALIGQRLSVVFSGVEEMGLMAVLRRVLQSGQAEHFPLGFYQDGRISGWRENFVYRLDSGELVAIYEDVTSRKQAEDALLQAMQSAEAADERKNVFLAMLAHELRNPLAPISNAAHVLGRLDHGEPRIKWAQDVIERQVTHLTRMVDDLLDASRIVRNKIALKKEPIEFAALIEHFMESARPLAERKGQRLVVRVPEQPVWLEGDPVRLTQALFNLVDNAVKYTQEGGQIEVNARVVGAEIEIAVQDNGMGIPANLLPQVFDLFQQDERTLDRAQGGLGIGLTLVQRLVGMHGGRVEARSEGPGQGATFTIWLPIAPAPAGPAVNDARNSCSPAAGTRILVVDDEPDVAGSMAMLLDMEGYEVRIAHTGQDALALIPLFRPHVVLLDIGLKGMDGFETAKRLRALPEGQDLCLIHLTGYGDTETRLRAQASGCDHFLVKPVEGHALCELLASMAGQMSSSHGNCLKCSVPAGVDSSEK